MFFRVLCGIMAVLALGAGQGHYSEDIVRLHVIAESDAQEDQELKLQVRDEVLDSISHRVKNCRNWDEVFEELEKCRDDVLKAAQKAAGSAEIRVETGIFEFDRRTYMGKDVPAGEYRAMRVVIGHGEGHNWWGIMFPGAIPRYTDEDTEYYSAIVEWILDLFGRDIE